MGFVIFAEPGNSFHKLLILKVAIVMHPIHTQVENLKVLYLMYQGLYESVKQLEEPRKFGKIRKTAEDKPR